MKFECEQDTHYMGWEKVGLRVDIVIDQPAVTMSSFKPTYMVGEDIFSFSCSTLVLVKEVKRPAPDVLI